MPVISILVGLAVGLAVWGVLDQIQGRAIKKIAGKELEMRLDRQAWESLIRFNQYLKSYVTTVRLLANHRSLAEYLEPLFWLPQRAVEPIVYRKSPPSWLTDFIKRNALPAPSYILLADTRGHIREMYQSGGAELPQELSQGVGEKLTDAGRVQAVVTRLDGWPYLLVSDVAEDMNGYRMGSLIMVVPINDAFLAASQRGLSSVRAAVALVDVDEQRILASVDPELLSSGTRLSEWRDLYLIMTQSLPEYDGMDWNLLFATFIPHHSVNEDVRSGAQFRAAAARPGRTCLYPGLHAVDLPGLGASEQGSQAHGRLFAACSRYRTPRLQTRCQPARADRGVEPTLRPARAQGA